MRTCAATNKCEFGYTTPSGEELRWGPTKFTLHADYHKHSHKLKTDMARTYHTVSGAPILKEQGRWCELCAWAHDKDCERLVAYRTEEARRTQELMAKARRETVPTRAQQQAARPEYTPSVEMQMRDVAIVKTVKSEGGEGKKLTMMRCFWLQAQEEAVLAACKEVVKRVEGAREVLRTEPSAVRTQTVCRDFRPHLGNCRFVRIRCKFFPCNRLKSETI
eukprot:4214526-Pleurochrysis_carterae.AAC.3